MSPAPEPPAVDFSFLFNQVSYALTARMAEALTALDLTISEYCVLWKAGEQDRIQIEIAELAALDKSTVVKAVDGLEREGLAERRTHASDRRAKVVHLTEAGQALLGRAHATTREVYADAFADLDAAELTRLVDSLVTLTDGALGSPSHVSALRRRRAPKTA